MPGALRDYDIPDLSRLAADKKQLWIDPENAVSERMSAGEPDEFLGQPGNSQIALTANGEIDEIAEEIIKFLNSGRWLKWFEEFDAVWYGLK